MSWITFIWSMTAGICLTLGAVHFLVWTRQRELWAHPVLSVTAAAAAGYAVLDMVALRVQTPAEYGELWRWALLLGLLEGVLIAWFIRLYLQAGRLWLLWVIRGCCRVGRHAWPGQSATNMQWDSLATVETALAGLLDEFRAGNIVDPALERTGSRRHAAALSDRWDRRFPGFPD